jgi:hypothetical protein
MAQPGQGPRVWKPALHRLRRKDLMVRVGGYSDCSCDLTQVLLDRTTARTEHQS